MIPHPAHDPREDDWTAPLKALADTPARDIWPSERVLLSRLLREHAERGKLLDNCRVALRSVGPVYYQVDAAAQRATKRGDEKTADALDHVYGRLYWLDHALGTMKERVDTLAAARSTPAPGETT